MFMRRIIALCTVLLLTAASAFSQDRTITGTVTDELGQPLASVTVQVTGAQIGTATGTDGKYSLSVSASAKSLTFTSVGKAPEEINIDQKSIIDVVLKSSNETLSEVVITAYGATEKKAFTGTASTIKSSDFKDLQVTSITGVLQGNASGVLSVSSNGQPGESPTIRIRGIGSVNASASPLIIVDGAAYGGNINGINPNDIESITILKDASSTALYGSRAANGVIQIVTKLGRGKAKINFSAVTGFSNRAVNDYDYVSSEKVYELTWEALKNEAIINPSLVSSTGSSSPQDYASKTVAGILVYNPFGVAQPVGLDGKIVGNTKNLWNGDWTDALLRTGIRKDYNVSVGGGNSNTRYFFSGGYLDDQSIVIDSRFKRYNGRLRVDSKVNDWLDAGVNTSVAYSTQNYPVQGGSAYSNVIGWIRNVSSIYPVYLTDPSTGEFMLDGLGKKQYDFGDNGPLKRPILTPGNPAATTSMNPTSYDRFITSVNAFGEATIIHGLKFRTQYAIDLYQIGTNTYYNPFVGDGASYHGRSYKSRDVQSTQTFTNTLTYDNNFGSHHINVLAGIEANKFHDEVVIAEARGFSFPGVTELNYGTTPYTAGSYSLNSRMVSYFSRLNYDLTDRYHLSLSLRTDGSSRFADSVRWGTFYSIGAAWNLNKESFFTVPAFSELKLRASYGTMGNQSLSGYFPYLGAYETGWNIADYSGVIISSLTNGSLHWETQKSLDLGIDFGIFRDRITGSVTYFKRTSADLLFDRPLPPSVGISGINDNIGKVENKGVEIDLTTVNISTPDFRWSTTFNATTVKNKIVELPQESIPGSGYSNLKVGESLYNFYLREYAGVDMADGRPMWYMDVLDDDEKVTGRTITKTYSQGTRYYVGTALPDWTGGVTSKMTYKNIDLNILIAVSVGGKIYDGDYAGLMSGNTAFPGYNWSTDILGRWQSPDNPGDGRTPILTATSDYQSTSSSSRFLYDASYARIRNITLGYNFPKELLRKASINSARFFVDYQNPFTFFGRRGLDPEAGLDGITSNTSSAYRTLSVGVNIGL